MRRRPVGLCGDRWQLRMLADASCYRPDLRRSCFDQKFKECDILLTKVQEGLALDGSRAERRTDMVLARFELI